jgi:hypothetical protein
VRRAGAACWCCCRPARRRAPPLPAPDTRAVATLRKWPRAPRAAPQRLRGAPWRARCRWRSGGGGSPPERHKWCDTRARRNLCVAHHARTAGLLHATGAPARVGAAADAAPRPWAACARGAAAAARTRRGLSAAPPPPQRRAHPSADARASANSMLDAADARAEARMGPVRRVFGRAVRRWTTSSRRRRRRRPGLDGGCPLRCVVQFQRRYASSAAPLASPCLDEHIAGKEASSVLWGGPRLSWTSHVMLNDAAAHLGPARASAAAASDWLWAHRLRRAPRPPPRWRAGRPAGRW